jgi:hypothetical protein
MIFRFFRNTCLNNYSFSYPKRLFSSRANINIYDKRIIINIYEGFEDRDELQILVL